VIVRYRWAHHCADRWRLRGAQAGDEKSGTAAHW